MGFFKEHILLYSAREYLEKKHYFLRLFGLTVKGRKFSTG